MDLLEEEGGSGGLVAAAGPEKGAAGDIGQAKSPYKGKKFPSPRAHPKARGFSGAFSVAKRSGPLRRLLTRSPLCLSLQHLIENHLRARVVKKEVETLRAKRDQLYSSWQDVRKSCRMLREQNRDLEDEVLDKGHMILLGLEMKLAVERRKQDLKKGEKPPQEAYKLEVSLAQASQKRAYARMIRERRTADRTCHAEIAVESKYKQALGKYEEATTLLSWRMAHGCFHHGLSHYCVRVTKWCGQGTKVHPCNAQAELTADSESKAKDKKRSGRRLLHEGEEGAAGDGEDAAKRSLARADFVPVETVLAARAALQHAAWPAERSCFATEQGKRHCATVEDWLRLPGIGHDDAVGPFPAAAFLPASIEIRDEGGG